MSFIVFTDGVKIEMGDKDLKALLGRMRDAAIRTFIPRYMEKPVVFVLSECAIARIELDTPMVTPQIEIAKVEESVPVEEKVEPVGVLAKEEAALEEIYKKQACTHPSEKCSLYKHISVKGTRYYSQCECGYRSRFIATDQLSEEAKTSAIQAKEE